MSKPQITYKLLLYVRSELKLSRERELEVLPYARHLAEADGRKSVTKADIKNAMACAGEEFLPKLDKEEEHETKHDLAQKAAGVH